MMLSLLGSRKLAVKEVVIMPADQEAKRQRDREYGRRYYRKHRDRVRVAQAEYQRRHSEQVNAKNRKWRAAHQEQQRRCVRQSYLRKQYGIDIAVYEQLLARGDRGCWLCGAKQADRSGRRLHVDHDHETGRVRGLLCASCNSQIIGRMEKRGVTPERLVLYFSGDEASQVIAATENKHVRAG